MKKIRSSDTAWQLLERLVTSEADLVQCSDPSCFRFHIRCKGVLGGIVRNSTLKTLVETGLVARARISIPTYLVSEKGLRELNRMLRRRQFAASHLTADAAPCESQAVFGYKVAASILT